MLDSAMDCPHEVKSSMGSTIWEGMKASHFL